MLLGGASHRQPELIGTTRAAVSPVRTSEAARVNRVVVVESCCELTRCATFEAATMHLCLCDNLVIELPDDIGSLSWLRVLGPAGDVLT